ncbi:hypothetical protein GOFOIKOB_5997 [Methylobacterium tardum]|nr:PAS domain-containing protein [Methylobacterium tardum]URD38717.1 PAS domain-containing protein [Methylobacterium tardum]GJE52922.1 hypothetical protein GOFOIKOB_5997 [Methylobacterium tardum]
MTLTGVLWPRGDGEMAARIRDFGWAATPLGPIEGWSQGLSVAVNMILAMPGPANILWGPAHVQLYNDAYIAIARDRHPELLGRPAAEGWPEIHAAVLAPVMEAALAGRATRIADLCVTLLGPDRQPEERAFDTTWSPIPDGADGFGGALEILMEVTDRRRTQAALRESEELRRIALESGGMGAWRWDTRSGLVRADDAFQALWGVSFSDALHPASVYADLMYPEGAASLAAVTAKPIVPEQEFQDQVQVAIGPNAGRWIQWRGRAERDRPWIINGVSFDITAQHLVQQRLREGEARLHRVLDGMGEGFGLLAPDFTILEHNHEALRLDGRRRDEIVGHSQWEAYPGSEHSEIGRLLKQAMFEREPAALEHRYTWADGRAYWLDMRAYPTSDGTLAVFWRDVTDRKHVEDALRTERDRSAKILESISDAFYAVDAEWRFTYVNGEAEAWWGRDRQDLLGKVFWEEFPQAIGSESYKAHLRAAETREVVRLEAMSPILNHWVDISIYPTADGGLSVYFRDMTRKKQVEDTQAILVAELQHRTRNLLGVVRSVAQQTLRTSASLDEFRTAFNERLGALSRVQGLLSRAGDEPITMDRLIRSELDALGAADIPERVTVQGPKVRLRKGTVQTLALALHELATNARKYGALTTDSGQLRVAWRTYTDETGRRLVMDWQEIGLVRQREEQSPTKRGGYGRELIERALPYALQARTSYNLGETELLCTVDLPLTEGAAPKTSAQ